MNKDDLKRMEDDLAEYDSGMLEYEIKRRAINKAELQHAMKGRKEFRILVMHNAEFIREILYPTMVDG